MKEINTQAIENENLFNAIEREDLNAAKEALSNGADVNYKDNEGNTALLEASFLGNLELIKLLVKNGADTNVVFQDIDTPLTLSIDKYYETKNLDTIEFLIENGANVNHKDSDGFSIFVVLLFLFNETIQMKLYNERGIKLSKVDIKKLINFFILKGLNVNDIYESNSILSLMISMRNIDAVKLLLDNGADVNHKNDFDVSVLMQSLVLLNRKFIEKIISDTGSKIEIPKIDIKKLINLLITKGANINDTCNSHSILYMMALTGNIDAVKLLLVHGVKPLSSENIITILFVNKQLFMVLNKVFLDYQVVVFEDFDKNRLEIVELLINNGVDVNSVCLSAIDFYFDKYEIKQERKYINSSELSVNEKVKSILLTNNTFVDIDLTTIEWLLINSVNINDEEIKNALYEAIKHDDLPLVKLLVKYMNNVNLYLDEEKRFPIFFKALEQGNYEIIELLLQNGMDVNKKDLNGDTPLLYAISMDDLKLVKLLIKYKADVNVVNDFIITISPLVVAVSLNKIEIVKLLIENGADMNFQAKFNFKSRDYDISVYEFANLHDDQVLSDYLELRGVDISLFNPDSIINKVAKKIKRKSTFDCEERNKPDSSIEEINQKIEIYKGKNDEVSNHHIKLLENNKQSKIQLEKLKKSRLDRKINEPINKIIEEAINSKSEEKVQELLDLDFILTDININDLFIEDFPIEFIIEVAKQTENVNITTEDGMTPLMYACGLDDFELVELLLDKGADKTIKNNMGKRAKDFTTNKELRLFLANYIMKQNNPQKLVNILTNFTIDTPIKYTTHEWRNRIDDKYFDDFDLFLQDIGEQFNNLGSELKTLSPNLYHKVEAFIVSTENPNSWQSMKGLKPWVEEKKEPFDFHIANENILFREIIESFKNEIEIRGNMLQEIFLEQKKSLGRAFKVTISDNLKGEKFYTDVETFKNAVDEIFKEIKKYAKEQQEYEVEVKLFKPENSFIELHIVHINSISTREAQELLERIKKEKGDSVLRKYLKNLCDWEIQTTHKNNHFTIDCFSEEIKSIDKPKGFTHIMRFYK